MFTLRIACTAAVAATSFATESFLKTILATNALESAAFCLAAAEAAAAALYATCEGELRYWVNAKEFELEQQ
jgi:hypothetical protein